MNDFPKTSLKAEPTLNWGGWGLSADRDSCRLNPDGTVDDNASSFSFPFPKTNSEDQRVCSLYRPNPVFPALVAPSPNPQTTRKSVCLEDAAKAEKAGKESHRGEGLSGNPLFQASNAVFDSSDFFQPIGQGSTRPTNPND